MSTTIGTSLPSQLPMAESPRRTVLPFPPSNSNARDFTVLVAIAAVVMLGLNQPLAMGATTGTVAVLALLPVWAYTLREFRFAPFLTAMAGLALASGAILSQFNGDRSFSSKLAVEVGLLFLTGLGGVGLLLWARTVMPLHWVVAAFAGSYLLAAVPAIPSSPNPWKYLVSVPLTMLVLAWAAQSRGVGLTLLGLGLIGLISVAADSRSYFGFCLLAIVLVIFQQRRASAKRTSKLLTVTLLALVIVALYFIGSALLVEGYLGQEAQLRTVEQIQQSGSLLTSGRPEWTATWQLMQDNPMGFGLGTSASAADVLAAKEGMINAGLTPDDGYLKNFMFGGQIKLHSIIADFWASFGIVGLVLALSIVAILGYCLLDHLSKRTASGLILMVSIVAIWDMFFGPINTNLPDVMLALAVVLPVAGATRGWHGRRVRTPSVGPGEHGT